MFCRWEPRPCRQRPVWCSDPEAGRHQPLEPGWGKGMWSHQSSAFSPPASAASFQRPSTLFLVESLDCRPSPKWRKLEVTWLPLVRLCPSPKAVSPHSFSRSLWLPLFLPLCYHLVGIVDTVFTPPCGLTGRACLICFYKSPKAQHSALYVAGAACVKE